MCGNLTKRRINVLYEFIKVVIESKNRVTV